MLPAGRALDLEHPLAPFGQEAGQPRPVRARALERPRPRARRLRLRKPQRVAVAARGRGDRALADQAAAGGRDQGERVAIGVRVDADHKVQPLCKHPSYLHVRGGE